MFQVLAGEIIAFKAKFNFAIFNKFAVFNFASGNTDRFFRIKKSASGTLIFFSQIGIANPAVHAARGNK